MNTTDLPSVFWMRENFCIFCRRKILSPLSTVVIYAPTDPLEYLGDTVLLLGGLFLYNIITQIN